MPAALKPAKRSGRRRRALAGAAPNPALSLVMSDRNDRDLAWRDDEAEAESWRPLTAAEAQALRARQPSVAPVRVLRAQAIAGVAVALVAGGITGRLAVMASALYGAAAVALPAAVMVGFFARSASVSPVVFGAMRLLAGEAVKLLLAVAMLALAPVVVKPLSWPALLIAMAVCLKVYWLALLWRGR
jgi:ATP synthase protein I